MKLGDKYPAVRDIADAVCEEQVTPEQIIELEQLLKGNPEAKRFYLDYIGIHTYLSSAAESNMEFVYRRIQTQTEEEFIVRPSGETSYSHVNINQSEVNESTGIDSNHLQSNQKHEPFSASWSTAKISSLLIVLCTIVAMSTWFIITKESKQFTAEIIDGRLSVVNQGYIDSPNLDVGEYEVNQDSRIKLANGEVIHLVKHSIFKLVSNDELELKRGALSVDKERANNETINEIPKHNATGKNATGKNVIVRGSYFALHTNGGKVSLDLRADKPIVSTGEKTLLIPHRWRPMHYWSFDSKTDRAIDSAGLAHGIVSFRATRTKGLIGAGAFSFDNSFDARIDVGSGGGTVPASGSFSVTDGVTIEALVRPNFSSEAGDMDEIFRKDQSDQDLRMLLSFQQDIHHKSYLMPDGVYKNKASLSFGLFLLGQGYQELKLALDGIDGRPSLAQLKDGNSHHIVATYNVSSGLKAIYVDGIQHAAYQYPAGSKMLSGGAGAANIGNSPNQPVPVRTTDVRFANNEAFDGLIDEVAFYNFSLPSFVVQQHYKETNQGNNYFGILPSTSLLPENIEVNLPPYSSIELDPLTGLPAEVIGR